MKLRQQVCKQASVALLMIFFIVSVAHAQQSQERRKIQMRTVSGDIQLPPPQPTRPPYITRKGNELQASAITRVLPKYPDGVKADDLSSAVIVDVVINREGNIWSTRALTGHSMFRRSVFEAVGGWKWEPALINGVPHEVMGRIRFDFDGNGSVSINTSADPEAVDPKSIYKAHLIRNLEVNLEELRTAPNPALYEKVAQTYLWSGRFQEAIETYKAGISRYPDEIKLYSKWAEIYSAPEMKRTLGEKNQIDEALKVLKLAMQIKVDSNAPIQKRDELCLFLCQLGATYLFKERFVDAKEVLERALSLNPSEKYKGDLYKLLETTYILLGDKDSIITLSQKILESGDTQSAIDLLGGLRRKFLERGDTQSAKELMTLMENYCRMGVPKPKSR